MDSWSYELPPVIAAIRPAAMQFREWARPRANHAAVADCELALVEACNNILMHNDVAEMISLRVEVNPFEIILTVRDKTEGFAWPSKPALPAADSEQGRGIFLMHSLMTDVQYRRHHGWNELRLRRRI
jgi:anti-sigma regulatory factor (Ser/Thr protein kinase)